MLKKRGNLLIALGLLLLIGAAGLTVYNLNVDKNAGQEAVAVVDDLNALLAETEIQVKSEPGWISDTEQRLLELDGRSHLGQLSESFRHAGPIEGRRRGVRDPDRRDDLRLFRGRH